MIKVGIYGSGTLVDPVRKQLLRLLLRHPDVDLCAVASPGGNTVPIAELHPVYAGETELTLERVLNLDGLDVLFVIDSENLNDMILDKYRNDPEFRLIVLGNADDLLDGDRGDMVYGLPEYYRRLLCAALDRLFLHVLRLLQSNLRCCLWLRTHCSTAM